MMGALARVDGKVILELADPLERKAQMDHRVHREQTVKMGRMVLGVQRVLLVTGDPPAWTELWEFLDQWDLLVQRDHKVPKEITATLVETATSDKLANQEIMDHAVTEVTREKTV